MMFFAEIWIMSVLNVVKKTYLKDRVTQLLAATVARVCYHLPWAIIMPTRTIYNFFCSYYERNNETHHSLIDFEKRYTLVL